MIAYNYDGSVARDTFDRDSGTPVPAPTLLFASVALSALVAVSVRVITLVLR